MVSPASTLTARRLTVAILSGLALLLASIFIFQPASAQREPARLKPPFKLVQIEQKQPLFGVPPLPLNAPIIISETFDASFVPASSLSGSGWHTVNFSGELQGYSWGRIFNSGLMTDTAWIAQERFPVARPVIVPGTPYTTNMNSLLIYGPINLSDYASIIVSATYFLDVHPEDSYGLAYSLDGTNFTAVSNEVGRDPALSARRTGYYSLPGLGRQGTVWLAFYFTSTDHPIDALGVFLDEVVVRGVKLTKIYLPILRFDPSPTPTPTSTPTVTPTPQTAVDNYTFGTGSNSDAEFIIWGGSNTYNCGTDCDVIQGVSTNGNPGGAVNFSVGGKNAIQGTSPNHTIPINYDLSADFMLIEGKLDGRFGLVFGASTSTFYNDGGVIKMDGLFNYYKVDLNVDPNDETLVTGVRLQRWTAGLATNLVNRITLPAQYQRSKGQWGNLRVVVQNSYITVYVNGYAAIVNKFDDTYTTSVRKYGVFMHSQASNNNANPFKMRFDNVIVRQLP